jgi:hypothetical protein
MQYAAAATTNNMRTAGGSVGRQGRVRFILVFEDLLPVFLNRDINSNIVNR